MVAPVVEGAISYRTNRVRVFFNEPMLGLNTAANFTIAGTTVTVAAASTDRKYADLTTTGMIQGDPYTVVCGAGVTDDDPEALALAQADFLGGVSYGPPGNTPPIMSFLSAQSLVPRTLEARARSGAEIAPKDSYLSDQSRIPRTLQALARSGSEIDGKDFVITVHSKDIPSQHYATVMLMLASRDFTVVEPINYMMRAWHTVQQKHVYWSIQGGVDFSGAESGYNPLQLEDIVLLDRFLGE